MILDYYQDVLMNIENFVDGIMVVDEQGLIRMHKSFSLEGESIRQGSTIGKKPEDVFSNLSKENSTVYQALCHGKTIINQLQTLVFPDGRARTMIDNTFPIRDSGKIIGAVSISKFIGEEHQDGFIDLSNMTSSKRESSMYSLEDIIGLSPAIMRIKSDIIKVARFSSSVLIHGESGTGKELVAQSIHSCSPRKESLFIAQNCSAIPHTLLESIFFGTKKGSYTGSEDRPGIFEIANGGTVFLDEINSMDLSMQAKLLKAIEEKKITRIGESIPRHVDVRIVSAINKPLELCLKNQELRQDFYYRLSAVHIHTPPLRERIEDISLLSNFFVKHFNAEFHRKITHLTPSVQKLFREYMWPGNVRELKNAIECAFNFASSSGIYIEDLPDYLQAFHHELNHPCSQHPQYNCKNQEEPPHSYQPWKSGLSLKEAVDQYEKACLLHALKDSASLTAASNKLQITRQNLYQKLKKYELCSQ